MKRNFGLFFCCQLGIVWLPVVVLAVAVAVVSRLGLPSVVNDQRTRLGAELRRQAEALINNPPPEIRPVKWQKGWRRVSKINGKPWGYFERDGGNFIWYELADRQYAVVRARDFKHIDYVQWFWLFAAGAGVMMIAMSSFCTIAFVRFLRNRDDFLAATAHDLTTPLVAMRMMIGKNDDNARILNERMMNLVTNIKDFLKTGGRANPTIERFGVIKAFEEAYAIFRDDFVDVMGEDVEVTGDDCEVMADRTMTVQILWNLLGNDLKYAAPYGKVRVRIAREETTPRMVRIEVIDEGLGMGTLEMRKVFKRYYRAKSVMESGKGGFGIGLCTSRELAAMMGGKLSVCKNSPRGMIFVLSLPAVI